MSTRVQVAKSMMWTVLESFGVSGLSIIGLIVVARYITPAEMGVASLAQSIVQLLNFPVEFLFMDALIRRRDADQLDYNTAHTFSAALGVALSLLCWIFSGPVAAALNVPEIAPVLSCMGISLALMGFGSTIVARQRKEMDFRTLAIRSFAGRFGGVTIGIIIAVMGGGVWSLVAQQVLMVGFATLALWLLSDTRPSFGFSYVRFRELALFGLRIMTVGGLLLAVPRIFMLMIGRMLGPIAAGYMSLAFRVSDILRDIVDSAAVQLALPMFSRHSDDDARLRNIYAIGTRYTCIVAFPVFAGIALCSTDMIRLVFGPQWVEAAPYVRLLCFLTMAHFARLYSNPILTARGLPRYAFYPHGAALLFVITGMLFFGHISLPAAAAVWALRLVVLLPLDLYNIKRSLQVGYYNQIKGALVPLACVAMMSAILLFAEQDLVTLMPLARLVIMIVLGAGVYFTSLWALDRRSVNELWQFLLVAIGRRRGSDPEP